jgi:hypothetical protein
MAGILDSLIDRERQKRADEAMLQRSSPMPVTSQDVPGILSNANAMGQAGQDVMSQPQMSPLIPAGQQPQRAPEAPKPPGFLSRLGTSLKDPTTLAGLSAAFNSMTLNPNQALQQRASDMMAVRSATKQANKTVEYLRAQGRDDLADLVESNPTMAAEVLKGLATSKAGGFMRKTVGGVQVDQDTGQMFTVEQDPNTGTITRTDIPGAFGPTEAEKNAALLEQTRATADLTQGQKKGEEIFEQFNLIDRQIQDFRRIGDLVDEGAKTGFLEKFIPSTDAATTELRQIANKMGIDIINSATFGALSATELRLALSTGFDQNLKGDDLVKYIQNKIAAQTKLRNALMPEVQMLLGGSGLKAYADYKIDNRKRHDAADKAFSKLKKAIPDLTKAEWETFNLEERESIMKGEGLL